MTIENEPLRSSEEFESALQALHDVGDRLLFEESFDAWKSSWLDSWAFGLSDIDDSDAFRMLLQDRLEHLDFVAQRFYRMDYENLVLTIVGQADVHVFWDLDRIRGHCEPSVLVLDWSRNETVTEGSSTWSLGASVRLTLCIVERPAFGGFMPPFSNRGFFQIECEAWLRHGEAEPDNDLFDDMTSRSSEVRKLRRAFQAEVDSFDEEQNTPSDLTIVNAEEVLDDEGANIAYSPAIVSVAAGWARNQLRQCTPQLLPSAWPDSAQEVANADDEPRLSESVQLALAELYELDHLLQAQPDLALGSLAESSVEASIVNAYLRFSDSHIIAFCHDVARGTLTLIRPWPMLQFPSVLPPRNHLGGTRGQIMFSLDEAGTTTLTSDGTYVETGFLGDVASTPPTVVLQGQSEATLRLPGISAALRRLLSYELLSATTSSDVFERVWSERHRISANFPEHFVARPRLELPNFDDLPF